jgi:molybdate transport system regulatory protein
MELFFAGPSHRRKSVAGLAMVNYPHASIRIELGPGRRLGPGKVRLLQLIGDQGSISAAARDMGMSYRRAWLLVEESNQLFQAPLVESIAGGVGGGGARLTPLGRKVIQAYAQIASDIESLVESKLAAVPEFETAARDQEKN